MSCLNSWVVVMTLTVQSYARNIHILFWVSLQQLLVNVLALKCIWLSISIFILVCVSFTILWAFNRSCSHLLSWILYLLFDLTGRLFMIITDKKYILLCLLLISLRNKGVSARIWNISWTCVINVVWPSLFPTTYTISRCWISYWLYKKEKLFI